MKKAIILIFIVLLIAGMFCGCNKTIIDTTYSFNYAFVALPDGTCVDGPIRAWKDWRDSDVIQVTFTDGTVYYTHASNVVLISGD